VGNRKKTTLRSLHCPISHLHKPECARRESYYPANSCEISPGSAEGSRFQLNLK